MDQRQTNLDFIRGAAALVVVLNHLRNFLFVDYHQVARPSVWDGVFYFATGIGREAVMVFFVLSGFFVGGSILQGFSSGKWSWGLYLANRLSRLWTVLLPALILTLFWDTLGGRLNPKGYDGSFYDIVHSGPALQAPLNDGAGCFFGNLVFVQTIFCPVYGSNTPLWSLANEFWYYLLFPLLLCGAASGKNISLRIAGPVIALFLMFYLPQALLLGGLVWLMGAGAFLLTRAPPMKFMKHPFFFGAGLLAFAFSLWLSKNGRTPAGDLFLGGTFALLLPFLADKNPQAGWYAKGSAGLSDISYTLYLAHFPLLAFFFFTFRLPTRIQPGPEGYLFFTFIMVLVLLYAALLWLLFEKRTPWVRKTLTQALLGKPKR